MIGAKALRLFPDATLCVGADEVDANGRLSRNLLVHPPEVVGIAGSGGNARQRSAERHAREITYLRHKWGPYLDVVPAKGTKRLAVRVSR